MTEQVKLEYAIPANRRRHSILTMAAISFGMAFLFAITYVVVMTLTLPKTDGAYGQMPFQDPLVFPVMAMGACFAAVVATLPFHFSCRSLPLGKAVTVIIGVTMTELLVVTPLDSGIGLLGSFVAFAIGLAVARAAFGASVPATGGT